jgi:sulfur carrier protein ThiS
VKVHLWGELGFYGPGRNSTFEFPLDRPMPLVEALALIGVPTADIAVLGLNGDVVRVDQPDLIVSDADRIDCFPPTSGG